MHIALGRDLVSPLYTPDGVHFVPVPVNLRELVKRRHELLAPLAQVAAIYS